MRFEPLRALPGRLMSILRKPPESVADNPDQVHQLSEAIVDYGRMMQLHFAMPSAIVEISELARRFRETPETIGEALLYLKRSGRAEPVDVEGCWKVRCSFR